MRFWLFLSLGICCRFVQAQNSPFIPPLGSRLTPTELSIPASPVFDIMGVTPSQVTRTSDIKDFKVDWSFKSWSLSPNISLESQPVWEVLYNRRDIKRYQRASPLMRKLAGVNVSAGTVLDENSDRRIGLAIKANLYKEKDPLLEKGYYEDIEKSIVEERKAIEEELKTARKELDTVKNLLLKPAIRQSIQSLEMSLLSLNSKRTSLINERASILNGEFWNSGWVDVGYGNVKSYITNANGDLNGLRVNRSTAQGLWVNAGKGLGKNLLISGLARVHLYDEQVNFMLENANAVIVDTVTVGSNQLFTLGVNLRYGNPYFSFFAECIYDKRALKTPLQAIREVFITPDNFDIIPTSVDWTVVHPYRINFGGDWRMSRNVLLNFSMQTIFDNAARLKTFLPVVAIACLMR